MAIGGGAPITNFSMQAMDQQLAIYNQLLLKGAENGKLNKEEFVDLNSDQNANAQLRDTFQKSEGLSPEEKTMLDARQLAYSNKLDKYRQGDFKPVPNEATLADKALNEQAGLIYDGVKEGTISRPEGGQLLGAQRDIAAKSLSANPVDQKLDLDTQAMDIKDARREKEAASTPAQTPAMPQISMPGFFGGMPSINWTPGPTQAPPPAPAPSSSPPGTFYGTQTPWVDRATLPMGN
jgi:hypothetical protein